MYSRKIMLFVAVAMAGAAGIACAHASATTTIHKLKSIVLESGNLGRTLNKGYNTIEQASISCSYYPGCTLGMNIMSNVGTATCKSEWAIVGLVDGNSVDGGPLLESLPSAGETQTHVWHGNYVVGQGNHNITFQLYLPCSANANQWSVRYLVTTP